MHKESIVMGLAGLLLGVMVGWIIGSQSGTGGVTAVAPSQQAATAPTQGQPQAPPALDEKRAAQLRAESEKNPRDAASRVQLGNLYFDSERFDDAVKWYTEALAIEPNDANVSTDLGIAYYYRNQPDRALEQFERSLAIDPRHTKTLLNIGVVRAWGKQDLEGAAKAWERVIEVAPNSEEAQRAKQGLEGIRAAHPAAGKGGAAK
jgi:tetratricopeptide (TPR) repeat protein